MVEAATCIGRHINNFFYAQLLYFTAVSMTGAAVLCAFEGAPFITTWCARTTALLTQPIHQPTRSVWSVLPYPCVTAAACRRRRFALARSVRRLTLTLTLGS